MLPHIYKDGGTIAISLPNGEMKMIDTAHKNYKDIVTAMQSGEDTKVVELINVVAQIERAVRASANTENVTIVDGEVLFQGKPIHSTLTTRIIHMADEGFDIGHMVLFLENLMTNPSYRAVHELYDFLEAGSIPITENGTFLTYKKIRENYTDIYTGKFDNSIGTTVSMPRNQVNEDSSQTCSTGLHVCSYDYLPKFGTDNGNRVVVCEVCPSAVVSIPTDYANTKMRVCSYTVVGELDDYKEEDILAHDVVMLTEDVPQPKEKGLERVLIVHSKAIGKMISTRLDFGEMTRQDIIDALAIIGLTDSVVDEIVDGSNKNVGKKITKAIREKIFEVSAFEDALIEVHNTLDDEEKDCYICGNTIYNDFYDDSDMCEECEECEQGKEDR